MERMMKVKDLFAGVFVGKPLKLRNLYSAQDTEKAIKSNKVSAQTVTIKNNSTGEVIGKRTLYQK
jgi:hypothetical protein